MLSDYGNKSEQYIKSNVGINLSHTTAMKLFCDYSHISLEIKNDKITKWKKTSILENTVHWGALIVS